jgi:Holliday junction DNA helicase RuvA
VISTLRGVVLSLSAQSVVVDVHGVGMKVSVPGRTSAVMRAGEEVTLHTTLIVREDDLSLYGFSAPEERDTFDLLCSVNGVGPKSALGVLNEMSVDDIAHAVASDNDQAFKAVSGIGPKTAKLIALSLQGKIVADGSSAPKNIVDNRISPADHTAIVQALVGLGWSEKVAKKGVADMVEQLPEGADSSVAALVKRALQLLGPQTSREDFS